MGLLLYYLAPSTGLAAFTGIQRWLENILARMYSTSYLVNLSSCPEKKQPISCACIITLNRLFTLWLIKPLFLFSTDPPEGKEEKPRAEAERAVERILMICWAPSRGFLHPPSWGHFISCSSTCLLAQLWLFSASFQNRFKVAKNKTHTQ